MRCLYFHKRMEITSFHSLKFSLITKFSHSRQIGGSIFNTQFLTRGMPTATRIKENRAGVSSSSTAKLQLTSRQ